MQMKSNSSTDPGSFRLSYLVDQGEVTASTFASPNSKSNGGHFLLLAGLPENPELEKQALKREVTLVLDRSGIMRGEKLDQVREAALQIIAGLGEGEAFNIITYNDSVNQFAPAPVHKSKQTEKQAAEYLKGITAQSGTNIHDALLTALRQEPVPKMLPIVLFLTDGLPTVGQTSEVAIRDVATKANKHQRRIFTFGVGVDVNTPLLDKIATETRAKSTYVLPKEDVEMKVGQVFKRLEGPILADGKDRGVRQKGQTGYESRF